MMKSNVLLYEKSFIPSKPPVDVYESTCFAKMKESLAEKMRAKQTEKGMDASTRLEDLSNEDFLTILLECGMSANEVILPCSTQKFLNLLERATQYAESMEGNISLMHYERRLFLLISAGTVCLNHVNKMFFSKLLECTFNIDFISQPTSGTTMILSFNDVGPGIQTLSLDDFRDLLAQLNNA